MLSSTVRLKHKSMFRLMMIDEFVYMHVLIERSKLKGFMLCNYSAILYNDSILIAQLKWNEWTMNIRVKKSQVEDEQMSWF